MPEEGRDAHLNGEVHLDGSPVGVHEGVPDAVASQKLPCHSAETANVVRGAHRLWEEDFNWPHEARGAPA